MLDKKVIVLEKVIVPVPVTGEFLVEVDGDIFVSAIAKIQDSLGNELHSTSNALDTYITNQITGYATSANQATMISSLDDILETLGLINTDTSSIDTKITKCDTDNIAGTVTANAGTNLNTSALALEDGGNLLAAANSLSSIDGKITACNTGAVVISSGTITSITNAVAVTGTFWQDTQPVSGTVGVSNFPTEYPLPSAQVSTLTPPAAITGFNLESTQEDVLENLETLNSLVPTKYDYISLTYTSENLTGVVFKLGGSGGTTVSTLTLAYDVDDNLTTVTKS